MSQTSKLDRYAARSENRISQSASRRPHGSNVIPFQPIRASSRPEHDRSAGGSAEIIVFKPRRRSRSIKSAPRSWWGEDTNQGNSKGRDEYSQRTRENILAIGWVGTLMAISYCMMSIPMN